MRPLLCQVMEILTTKLETSQLPHFYTLQTMGSLSTSNVYTMVPFLKGILGPMQPMLNMVKQDNLKWAFAFGELRRSSFFFFY